MLPRLDRTKTLFFSLRIRIQNHTVDNLDYSIDEIVEIVFRCCVILTFSGVTGALVAPKHPRMLLVETFVTVRTSNDTQQIAHINQQVDKYWLIENQDRRRRPPRSK